MKKILIFTILMNFYFIALECSAFTFTPSEIDPWNRADKFLHLGLFAGISGGYYVMDRPYFKNSKNPERDAWLYSVLTSVTVGLAEEIGQGNFPRKGDGFSYRDLAAGAIGASIGATLVMILDEDGSDKFPIAKWYREKPFVRVGTTALISASHCFIDRGFYYEKEVSTPNCIAFSLTSALSIGLSQELTRMLIPDEKFSWKNIGLDIAGSALGILIVAPFTKPGMLRNFDIWDFRF